MDISFYLIILCILSLGTNQYCLTISLEIYYCSKKDSMTDFNVFITNIFMTCADPCSFASCVNLDHNWKISLASALQV